MIGAGICINIPKSAWISLLMRGVSLFGDSWPPYLLTLMVGITFFLLKKRIFAYAIVLAPAVGDIVKIVLKNILERPRPGVSGCLSLVNLSDYAMPSGHTIFYTIFFGLIAWYSYTRYWKRWYGKLLVIFSSALVTLVGFSRIYLGAHWVSDVVIGYAIGGLLLYISIKLINKYEK
jgi:membrane-associated phospholipid phosphatase